MVHFLKMKFKIKISTGVNRYFLAKKNGKRKKYSGGRGGRGMMEFRSGNLDFLAVRGDRSGPQIGQRSRNIR